jgi:tripartite-type tricarboxylate transporter receptor subunit TctC
MTKAKRLRPESLIWLSAHHENRTSKRRLLAIAAVVVGLASIAGPVAAETYPNRPIRIVVPFAAGGAVDLVARLVQSALEKSLGSPVIVENRAGASGITGSDMVAKSPPDGHSLLVVPGTHTVTPAVMAKMPYDTENDLTPVVLIVKNPVLFVINPGVPARAMEEFVSYVRANPHKVNYGSPGAASHAHLLISLWSRVAKIEMQHIPYRGGGPATLSTVAGETQFAAMSVLGAGQYVKSGQLRAIAIGRPQRDPELPDVPTLEEAGYPEIDASSWMAMFAPRGTPREIIERLNDAINRALRTPEMIATLQKQGSIPGGGSPEALGERVSQEVRQWTKVARDSHIVVQP